MGKKLIMKIVIGFVIAGGIVWAIFTWCIPPKKGSKKQEVVTTQKPSDSLREKRFKPDSVKKKESPKTTVSPVVKPKENSAPKPKRQRLSPPPRDPKPLMVDASELKKLKEEIAKLNSQVASLKKDVKAKPKVVYRPKPCPEVKKAKVVQKSKRNPAPYGPSFYDVHRMK